MSDARSVLAWSGVASSLVGFGGILLATTLSPTFSWTADAISDLGAPGAANPWLLNGGLVAASLVGLPFGWVLWSTARHALERLGSVAFAGSLLALLLVGVYPTGTAAHTPAAVAYFVLFTLAMWLHGSGAALVGDVERGLVEVWLGIAHVLAWLLWGVAGPDGLAIPEIAGSLLLFAWVVRTTRWVRTASDWAGTEPDATPARRAA